MNQKNDGQEIVAGRVGVYGDPTESFARVAEVWSGILGVSIQAWQVPLCLAGLKLVRTAYAPDYSDNSSDVGGYVDIFKQVIGPDMIDAETVAQYLAIKEERAKYPLIEL